MVRQGVDCRKNIATAGPYVISMLKQQTVSHFFAAQCIWAYFGCGARHDEATCKQRFDDCVSGESCK